VPNYAGHIHGSLADAELDADEAVAHGVHRDVGRDPAARGVPLGGARGRAAGVESVDRGLQDAVSHVQLFGTNAYVQWLFHVRGVHYRFLTAFLECALRLTMPKEHKKTKEMTNETEPRTTVRQIDAITNIVLPRHRNNTTVR